MQQSVTMSVRLMLVLSQLIASCLGQYIGGMGSAMAVGTSSDGIGPGAGCGGGIGTIPLPSILPPNYYYPNGPRYGSGYPCAWGCAGGHGYDLGNGGAYGYAAAYGGGNDQALAYGGGYGQPLSYGSGYSQPLSYGSGYSQPLSYGDVNGQGYAPATPGIAYGSGTAIANGDGYGGYGSSAAPYQYTPFSAPVIAAPAAPAAPVVPMAAGVRSPPQQVSSNENANTNINVNNQFGKRRYLGREVLATPQ